MSEEQVTWVFVESWGKLGYTDTNGKAYLHCQINSVSIRQFAQFGKYFESLKDLLRKRGYTEVYSLIQTGHTIMASCDPLVKKFQIRFGMTEVETRHSYTTFRQDL